MKVYNGYLLNEDVIYKGIILEKLFGRKIFYPYSFLGGFTSQKLYNKNKGTEWFLSEEEIAYAGFINTPIIVGDK